MLKSEQSHWKLQPQFTLLGVDTEVGVVRGVGLAFEDWKSADLFAEVVIEYLGYASSMQGVPSRRFTISFDDHQPDDGRSDVRIFVPAPSRTAVLSVKDIDRANADELEASLQRYKYYFLVAGISEAGSFIPKDPKEFHVFKADIVRNGAVVLSNRSGLWPKDNPLTS
jgi:hypothetical protein